MSVKSTWNKFLGLLEGGSDDEEWDEQDSYEYEYAQEEEPVEELELPGTRKDNIKSSSNVVAFDTQRDMVDATTIIITRPQEMQDATLICDHIREGKICIVNMQGTDHVTAQRIADYLGGVSYALNGQVERIDSFIFVMAPVTAKIAADLIDDLKGGKVFNPFGRA